MELCKAVEITRALAKGINPTTGEAFAENSPYNHPDIVRALYEVVERMPKSKKTLELRQQENAAKGIPLNSGLPWTDESRAATAKSYAEGTAIEKIAAEQKRSSYAILAELKRQGAISFEEAEKLGLTLSVNR